MRRQALRSPRERALRKKRLVRLCVAFIVAAASVCVALFFLFNSNFVRVSSVSVVSPDARLGASVQSVINNTIAGKYLGLVPKDSSFFFPFRSLTRSIAAQFPQVADISFSRQSPSSVVVALFKREPAEIVCLFTNDCYAADDNGVIFESSTTTGPYLIYNLSLPKGAQPIGLQFIDSGRLVSLAGFVAGLSRLGFSTESISLLPERQYGFILKGVSAQASSTMRLFIDENRPFNETLTDFSAFWQTHIKSILAGKEKQALSSVDMRYGDNIIYK